MTDVTEVPQADQVRLEVDPAAVLDAYARHRRRFAADVADLTADELAVPSRCSKWTVADVLRHCIDADGWMTTLWAGQQPPFDNFDPLRTPDEFVERARGVPDLDIRDRYCPSAESMAAQVEGSGPERWGDPGISPLGFVPWWLSAFHMFYDSWLHWRDVLLPLGREAPAEADETVPMLAYSLGIVGILTQDPVDAVVAGVRLVAPEKPVVVTPVDGAAADPAAQAVLVDAISGRGPLEPALPGEDPDLVHTLGTLARIFNP